MVREPIAGKSNVTEVLCKNMIRDIIVKTGADTIPGKHKDIINSYNPTQI